MTFCCHFQGAVVMAVPSAIYTWRQESTGLIGCLFDLVMKTPNPGTDIRARIAGARDRIAGYDLGPIPSKAWHAAEFSAECCNKIHTLRAASP